MLLVKKTHKSLDFRIESVINDMLSIAQASLHEINHMKTPIKNASTRIDFMVKTLIHMKEAFTSTRQETISDQHSRCNDTSN